MLKATPDMNLLHGKSLCMKYTPAHGNISYYVSLLMLESYKYTRYIIIQQGICAHNMKHPLITTSNPKKDGVEALHIM